MQEPEPHHAFSVCLEQGCSELVPYVPDGPPTPECYCEKHRVLFELDRIDGSVEDMTIDDD